MYNNIQLLHNAEFKISNDEYRYPITWNGMVLEMSIRHFIRLTTRIEGLEKFFNLNCNSRYRGLEIEWDITFSYLNDNDESETYFKTNNLMSKQKRIKVQRLIEEMPTIKQLKKSSYDLYRGIFCPMCKKKKETFSHIWKCRHHKNTLKDIMELMIDKVIDLLVQAGADILTINKNDLLALPMFQRYKDDDNCTFEDMLKGIFPLDLYSKILVVVELTKKSLTKDIGVKLLNFIFKETHRRIWLTWCEHMKNLERSQGITKASKKLPNQVYKDKK